MTDEITKRVGPAKITLDKSARLITKIVIENPKKADVETTISNAGTKLVTIAAPANGISEMVFTLPFKLASSTVYIACHYTETYECDLTEGV